MKSVNVRHGCFFNDGKRRADYVIVLKERSLQRLSEYFTALEKLGLQFELRHGLTILNDFMLIHIPEKALNHFSKLYDIGNEEVRDILEEDESFAFLNWRKPSLLEEKEEEEYTSAQRIVIIHKILEKTQYGSRVDEVGLSKLIRLKFVQDAYPLHDGTDAFEGHLHSLNDRQLLHRYWASFRMWYKEIPLDAIQRYFGCEIAFYFAWVEFFNIMLLPASFVGLLVILLNGVIISASSSLNEVEEVCKEDDMFICPTCEHQTFCEFKKLSASCSAARATYVFDNYLTVFFAVFMSFWGDSSSCNQQKVVNQVFFILVFGSLNAVNLATLFINLWRRKQNKLILKWDLQYIDSEEKLEPRVEYLETLKRRRAKETRINRITGELEPADSKHMVYFRMAVAIFICILLILLVLVALMGVILYKISINAAMSAGSLIYFKKRAKLISTITGSILQVIFIKIFGKMYGKLSIWLTKYENPRTQYDFDNSVLYKRYFLSFANNYAALFYLAFFKGRFFKLPPRDSIFRPFQQDTCQPTTCILSLCIQIFFLMLLKKFVGNILTFMMPHMKKCCNRLGLSRAKDKAVTTKQPQHEQEYLLLPTNRYLLTTEFCEMIIEYGFVTFFVAAFPLAPLCALLNNLLEQRLDAHKLVTMYRRPVARKVSGIGSWDGILLGLTYLSTATNAFVIAFTSDFVGREVYRYNHKHTLEGYVNHTLTLFEASNYTLYKNIPPKPNTCYFKGMMEILVGKTEYQMTGDYWVELTWRLITVFLFEHIIFLCNGILSYAIPDIPRSVKIKLNQDRQRAREAKLKLLNDDITAELGEAESISSFQEEEQEQQEGDKEEEAVAEEEDEKEEEEEDKEEEEEEDENEEEVDEDEDEKEDEDEEVEEEEEEEEEAPPQEIHRREDHIQMGPVIGPFRK